MSRRLVAVALGALFLAPAPASAGTPPLVGARSAFIMEARSGRVLYDLRGDQAAAPASLAKMATALVVAERLRPSDLVKISHAAATAREDSVLWPEGATFTVDQVLHAMIMESSNGAAVALAERAAGSAPTFLGLVNEKVTALGATHTHLETPNGLDAPGQHSTARDLAVIAKAFLEVPWLSSVAATPTYQILRWPPRGDPRTLNNRNDFLRQYRGAIGLKNGYTSQAGNSVVAAAVRNEAVLIVVVLNDRSVYADAALLMDFGFSMVGEIAAAAPAVQEAAPPVTTGVNEPKLASSEQLERRTPPSFAPEPQPSREAPSAGLPLGKLTLFGLAFAYVGRVAQVRSRKLQRRRARAAAARAERMRPMYIPMQRSPQRSSQRPVARKSASRASLHVATERDRQQQRSRRRAL